MHLPKLRNRFRKINVLTLALGLSFQLSIVSVIAADPPVVGPIGSVGPQGLIGPDPAKLGPQGTVGPTGLTGPQPLVSPSPTPNSSPTPAIAAAATLSTAAASGDDTSATNTNTGAQSANQATVNDTKNTTLTQNNTANIGNTVNVAAATGNSTASNNTGKGTVDTGDVNGQVTVINVANARALDGSNLTGQILSGNQTGNLTAGTGSGTTLAGNNGTGSNSLNQAQIGKNNTVMVSQNNTANAANNINLNANTGNNSASNNTGDGTVNSGNVNLAFNLLNLMNLNAPIDLDVISVFGDLLADLILPTSMASNNGNTGANSINQSSVGASHNLTTTLANNATIANNLNYNVGTGGNSASNNTLDGSVKSGKIDVQTAINNIANAPANMLYLINVFGECECDTSALDSSKYVLNLQPINGSALDSSNAKTGANSVNQSGVTDNTNVTLAQTNTANVVNNLNVTANTGNNSASSNTGKGSVTSGNVNVMAQIANILNTKVKDGQKFVLGIVNIFGKWKGKGLAQVQAKPAVASIANPVSAAIPAIASVVTPTNQTQAFVSPVLPSNPNMTMPVTSATVTVPTATSPATPPAPKTLATGRGGSRTSTGNSNTTVIINNGNSQTSNNNSTNNVSTGVTIVTDNSTPTPVASFTPAPARSRYPFVNRFVSVAHAATNNSILNSKTMPYWPLIVVPLALWGLSELAFSSLIRRRRQNIQQP